MDSLSYCTYGYPPSRLTFLLLVIKSVFGPMVGSNIDYGIRVKLCLEMSHVTLGYYRPYHIGSVSTFYGCLFEIHKIYFVAHLSSWFRVFESSEARQIKTPSSSTFNPDRMFRQMKDTADFITKASTLTKARKSIQTSTRVSYSESECWLITKVYVGNFLEIKHKHKQYLRHQLRLMLSSRFYHLTWTGIERERERENFELSRWQ